MSKDMYYKTYNKMIACKPPKQQTQATKKIGGLAIIDEKLNIQALEVVFDSGEEFEAGDVVYVDNGAAMNHKWYTAVFSVDETEFVLVPMDMVLLAGTPN